MALKFKPNGDRILIEPAPVQTKTEFGIYIPDTAVEKPQKGTVVAAGQGRYADSTGYLIPLNVKVGDTVLYGKYGGIDVNFDGKDYLIMRDTDILAVI